MSIIQTEAQMLYAARLLTSGVSDQPVPIPSLPARTAKDAALCFALAAHGVDFPESDEWIKPSGGAWHPTRQQDILAGGHSFPAFGLARGALEHPVVGVLHPHKSTSRISKRVSPWVRRICTRDTSEYSPVLQVVDELIANVGHHAGAEPMHEGSRVQSLALYEVHERTLTAWIMDNGPGIIASTRFYNPKMSIAPKRGVWQSLMEGTVRRPNARWPNMGLPALLASTSDLPVTTVTIWSSGSQVELAKGDYTDEPHAHDAGTLIRVSCTFSKPV